MRYRVDDLAAACGLSVDTVRYYQSKGLLPPPEREGRVAWYGSEHADRLNRIKELQAKGLSLAVIGRVVAGDLDAGEQALAAALAGPLPGEEPLSGESERFGLDELSQRTGVSSTLLQALEREGLLVGRTVDGVRTYSAADEGAVKAGLALLQAGVPLSEMLALAREHDAAMRGVAEQAVELFARYVLDPIRGAASDDNEGAQRMVAALHSMLPAASDIVAYHFRRRLLEAAGMRIAGGGERDGADGLLDGDAS